MVIVIMGVSGSGKTTVGRALAERLGARFVDGDEYHPPANVVKMGGGTPLTEGDREAWLRGLRVEIDAWLAARETVVLACSALTRRSRDLLGTARDGVRLVHLRGTQERIAGRMRDREHFMPVSLLASQFAALEPPEDALELDVTPPPDELVARIAASLATRRSRHAVGLVFLTFFVISFLTNIIGPLVPEIIDDFALSLTMVAVLPFAFFIAYGVMSIPAGLLIERFREKPVMIAAFGVAFVGSSILAVFPNYLTAIGSLFLIGSGMAMLQVAINPLLREAGGEEHYAFNATVAQLVFGAASFLSPLVYSYLVLRLEDRSHDANALIAALGAVVPADLPWISLYWLFAVIALLMIGVVAVSRIPTVERTAGERVGAFRTHAALLRRPMVLLYFLGIFTYVGLEQGVANWMSEFLRVYHGYDPQTTGATAVSWFWGLMTVGGIAGVVLLKLLDSRIVLVAFTAAAIASFTGALLLPGPAARIAFPLVGFFAAVMYPVIFSLALNSVPEHHGSFAGILVSAIIGGAVVPLVVGGLGDLLGLRSGMLFLYVTLGYILAIGLWAKPLITNATITFSGNEPT